MANGQAATERDRFEQDFSFFFLNNKIYFALTLHVHHGLSGGSATHHPHFGTLLTEYLIY